MQRFLILPSRFAVQGSAAYTFTFLNQFYRKLIMIAMHGKWKADAVGIFQHNLTSRITQNIEIISKELDSYNNDEIYSFWRFCFDGPHPDDQINKKLLHPKSISKTI